ncbi:TrmH family RNA methyltransferase [Salibacter halophilus]|uniref:RNA methyltransferase n=1 Tax=Salibacter halophilus TaxID=1803916 RepID=A0A6N6M9W3_9FLAO|nr:RNA methyltransferase [Salibacter halophilus]KAB1066022.1 RNA methyltransferase [Salibacter halophilus]
MLSKRELKILRSLRQKKFRNEHGKFLVEGEKLVQEAIESDFEVEAVYHGQSQTPPTPSSFAVQEVSQKELSQISSMKNPPGIMALVKFPDKSFKISSDKILAVEGINDPGNLGTILRIADWFGIETVLCSEETVDEFNPKVIQSSMGSIFRTRLARVDLTEKIEKLKAKGYSIVGAEMSGKKLDRDTIPQKAVLVMGSESHGISPEIQKLLDFSVTIEKRGGAESLNVAVATGIILSYWV